MTTIAIELNKPNTINSFALILLIMFSIGGNHIGFSPLYFCLPVALSLILHIRRKNKSGIFSSILCFLTILIFDKFNILVEYNEWLRRGMPDPFTWF